jgi:hypothetical protein
MQGNGIVLETLVRDVYHVESGSLLKSLMVATMYQRPNPQLVLTREILMPNATDVTVTYTLISGATLEDWKRNLEETSLMYWKHLRGPKSGAVRS